MAIKNILVHVDHGKAMQARVGYALRLAQACDAHLTGLHCVAPIYLPGYVRAELPEPLEWLVTRTEPFHLSSRYGLFAVMTTTRPEIILEGSRDGKTWLAYEFKYKPGDVLRAPRWVAPHQPRLDWQMWFAALAPAQESPWLQGLCIRLLQGKPELLWLLERDPFAGRPPRYLRALLYTYRFTTAAEHAATGAYWHREPQLQGGTDPIFFGPVSLSEPAAPSE